jgi:hypothetical protein
MVVKALNEHFFKDQFLPKSQKSHCNLVIIRSIGSYQPVLYFGDAKQPCCFKKENCHFNP